MKKICAILLAFLLVCVPITVLAVGDDDAIIRNPDSIPDAEKDDLGRYVSGGYLYLVFTRDSKYFGSGSTRVDLVQYMFENIEGSALYITYDASFHGYSVQNWNTALYTYIWTSNQYPGNTIVKNIISGSDICGYNLDSENDWDSVNTNLPIFDADDIDAIKKYLDDGDISGALNDDDLNAPNPEYGEVDIPLKVTLSEPYNKGLGTSKQPAMDMVINWSQVGLSLDGCSFTVDVKVDYKVLDASLFDKYSTANGEYSSDWFNVASKAYTNYSPGRFNIDIDGEKLMNFYVEHRNIFVKFLNDHYNTDSFNIPFSDWYVTRIYVRVRNVRNIDASLFDKLSNVYYSDYVYLTIDREGYHYRDTEDGEDKEVTTEDYTIYEPSTDIPDYNPDNTSEPSGSITDNDIDASNFDLSEIIKIIKSGFGLAGSAGFIALLASTFTFIPVGFWTPIIIALCCIIFLAIVALVVKIFT